MPLEIILSIVGLVLAGGTSTIGVYVSSDRKIQENKLKISYLEKELKDVQYRLELELKETKNKVDNLDNRLQQTLYDIQTKVHEIYLNIEKIKIKNND